MKKLFRREHLLKMTPARLVLDLFLLAILIGICFLLTETLCRPGHSFAGTPPPLTAREKSIEADLRAQIQMLGGTIGERNSAKYEKLNAAADYIASFLRECHYEPQFQNYYIDHYLYKNVWAELPGTSRASEIIVVGAHYDSVIGAPGANDNGTGTATVLELAKLCAGSHPQRTIRFVFFTNEEPPYFSSEEMGSYHYATACKDAGENIVAMLDPETLGYYTDAPNSQHYPAAFVPFYPRTGNFIGFIANQRSRKLVQQCVSTFRESTAFPSEGVAAPEWINGVDWADHRWFWHYGYPAVMITDTALYRYPYYHTAQDTPEKITYPPFARVVGGLHAVLVKLSDSTW